MITITLGLPVLNKLVILLLLWVIDTVVVVVSIFVRVLTFQSEYLQVHILRIGARFIVLNKSLLVGLNVKTAGILQRIRWIVALVAHVAGYCYRGAYGIETIKKSLV